MCRKILPKTAICHGPLWWQGPRALLFHIPVITARRRESRHWRPGSAPCHLQSADLQLSQHIPLNDPLPPQMLLFVYPHVGASCKVHHCRNDNILYPEMEYMIILNTLHISTPPKSSTRRSNPPNPQPAVQPPHVKRTPILLVMKTQQFEQWLKSQIHKTNHQTLKSTIRSLSHRIHVW